MTNLIVYQAPGACSRVTLNALEEIGVEYADRTVAFMLGAQRTPEYLAINPKGKVPVLVADGQVITESPSILFFLDRTYPEGGLLPRDSGNASADMRGLSDLIWCAGTLHPLLHRFVRPGLYAEGGAEDSVKAVALQGLQTTTAKIAERVANGGWWYGGAWSIVDTYLNWILAGARRGGLAIDQALVEHSERVEARPAFKRARAREIASVERDSLALMPGLVL